MNQNFDYALNKLYEPMYTAISKCLLEHSELEITSTGTLTALFAVLINLVTEAQTKAKQENISTLDIDANLILKFIALSALQDWKNLDPEIQKHLTLIAFKKIDLGLN